MSNSAAVQQQLAMKGSPTETVLVPSCEGLHASERAQLQSVCSVCHCRVSSTVCITVPTYGPLMIMPRITTDPELRLIDQHLDQRCPRLWHTSKIAVCFHIKQAFHSQSLVLGHPKVSQGETRTICTSFKHEIHTCPACHGVGQAVLSRQSRWPFRCQPHGLFGHLHIPPRAMGKVPQTFIFIVFVSFSVQSYSPKQIIQASSPP